MQPWARVKHPTLPPTPLRARTLTRLDPDEFAVLVRDNLIPHATDAAGKRQWRDLWQKIAEHEPLRERTIDLLDTWTEQAEAELGRADLDQFADRRVRKFLGKVDAQLRFLDAHPVGLTRHEAATVRRLVHAIAAHRTILRGRSETSDPADRTVWVALEAVGLDPDHDQPRMRAPTGYQGTLQWAGTTGERYRDPAAVTVIDYLVQAIHRHRTAKILSRGRIRGTDRVMWGILRAIRLDPQRTYTVRDGTPATGGQEALEWAGSSVEGLTPTDRVVLDGLVEAIATHRATTDPEDDIGHDRDLWEALDTVGLDPSGTPGLRVPDKPDADVGLAGMSPAGAAVAAYLAQAIAEHRDAELENEEITVDHLDADDPCRVLWSALDIFGADSTR